MIYESAVCFTPKSTKEINVYALNILGPIQSC